MSPIERELLVEQVAGAFRERDADGRLRAHPAWHDLDEQGRLQAFDAALVARRLEVLFDPDGLSATARAVLSRITSSR
jgi:hypothetical protein